MHRESELKKWGIPPLQLPPTLKFRVIVILNEESSLLKKIWCDLICRETSDLRKDRRFERIADLEKIVKFLNLSLAIWSISVAE